MKLQTIEREPTRGCTFCIAAGTHVNSHLETDVNIFIKLKVSVEVRGKVATDTCCATSPWSTS